MIRTGLALALWLTAGPALATDLPALITERLGVMKDVAAWKRMNDKPVEDLPREAVVLDNATAKAAQEGLDPATVRPFFQAQIDAAKGIQTCWIDRWDAGSDRPPGDAPDLMTDIRPRLIELGDAILARIKSTLAEGGSLAEPSATLSSADDIDCLDPTEREAVAQALSGVETAP
ncbi:MAG: gamma subclass chorismate mutase AroQ [Pseudomonadota bacterium]